MHKEYEGGVAKTLGNYFELTISDLPDMARNTFIYRSTTMHFTTASLTN